MAEKRPDTSTSTGNTTRFLGGTADSTPTTTSVTAANRRLRTNLDRLKHVDLPFVTVTVDNNDTFTIHDGTTYFAPNVTAVVAMWQPADPASDIVTCSLNDAGTVVTFVGAATGYAGRLHLWVTG